MNSANINAPGQIVVSGHKALIDKLTKEGKSLGAKRVIPLAVSGPFHSSMMQVIEENFASFIINSLGMMLNFLSFKITMLMEKQKQKRLNKIW